VLSATLYGIGEQATHRIEAIQVTTDVMTAGLQVKDGHTKEAVKTGLSTAERLAGAWAGARLFGAAGVPFGASEVTAPIGAVFGSFAPHKLGGINDAIVGFPGRVVDEVAEQTGQLEVDAMFFIFSQQPQYSPP
jgi:hypothetical protein